MSNEYTPLQLTFVADPPMDRSVLLINILQGQCEVSDEYQQAVIQACKFIVDKYASTNSEEKTS